MPHKDGDPTVRPARAAVALRLSGASYEEVAREIGYRNAESARAMVERELGKWADGQPEEREKLRKVASARLDSLLKSVWRKAMDPNDPEHLNAVRAAQGLVDRSIRLFGLDAPTEVVLHSPTELEIEQWVSRMIGTRVAYGDVVDAEVIFDGEADPGPVRPETPTAIGA